MTKFCFRNENYFMPPTTLGVIAITVSTNSYQPFAVFLGVEKHAQTPIFSVGALIYKTVNGKQPSGTPCVDLAQRSYV